MSANHNLLDPLNALASLDVDVAKQVCFAVSAKDEVLKVFHVSTAKSGLGQEYGSWKTPLGIHKVIAKAGINAPIRSVYEARIPLDFTFDEYSRNLHPEKKDWILSRIFWLSGCEPGFNLGGRCDTQSRMIYIHGAPDDVDFTQPGSMGCVRMKNKDIVALEPYVYLGLSVRIYEHHPTIVHIQ